MKYDYQKLKIKVLVFVYEKTVKNKEQLFARNVYRRFRWYPATKVHDALSYANDLGWIDSKWTKKGNKWMREITMPYEVRDTVKMFWKRIKKKR